jgi:GT2 family glycosyltransferase
MKKASVTVTIVAFNSERFIRGCLETVFQQTHPLLNVVVVDNASTDRTRFYLEQSRDKLHLIYNESNVGFAAAQNQAIRASFSDWVLVLNPDTLLAADFVERLLEPGQSDERVGTVCGKLLRIGEDLIVPGDRRIDSAGIYFTPNMRHFDRGWQERAEGRFDQPEYVFGASAAAALYRREMIEDVSLSDEFFDPDFFAYREDADVAWRAQLLGWTCLYTPYASAYHVRRVFPGNRRQVPAVLNMHSVKNRFLMRIKNATGSLYRSHWKSITARDVLVVGGCLFYEPSSLPAFWRLLGCLPGAIEKRRMIMSRKRVSDEYMANWFQPQAAPQPAPEFAFE